MRYVALMTIALLSACGAGDETVSAYGGAGQLWVLESIDNAPYPARATLSFPEEGKVQGEGPCNTFTANQNAPYPWFELADVSSTLANCRQLNLESLYFEALAEMELVEVLDDVMLLKTPGGREMVFRAGAYP